MRRKWNWKKSGLSFLMTIALSVSGCLTGVTPVAVVEAAENVTITSMDYYPGQGPDFSASTLGENSFGFIMPTFNGGSATFGDVVSDLGVNVLVDGKWIDIDSYDALVYNSNWGHWNDGGFSGYWFRVSETTRIQLYSKANPNVTLQYNMIISSASVSDVTGLAPVASTTINGNRSGSGFIAFPNAVAGGTTFSTGAALFDVYVKSVNDPDSAYVNIDNNAASGWIYDTNFGIEDYGYWFKVEESGSINVKLVLKDKQSVSLVYTITYSETKRDDYTVYANGSTTITADANTGACGVVLPWLGGTGDDHLPTSKELGNFVYQYYSAWNNQWVDFTDPTDSNFFYQGSGYVDFSSKNQWGYFDDYVYGLWFQPVTEDFKLRIGYPMNGEQGGEVGNNYIEYTFVGAPNAYRPVDVVVDNITVDSTGNNADLEGWDLYFSDEFSGTTLNMDNWNYNTGYFIDPSEPGTKGWGNDELEYYTDSTDNIFVSDGKLHLKAERKPYTFTCTDANRTQVTAEYASGKITSKDKVTFTYGRIDFRAKLPEGTGLWPALWMLPNDDTYGTWAASGEIDVMEARGRINNVALGTLHFGGQWPNNKDLGGSYTFPEGTNYADGYHVYSCIWEEDNLTFYVDGNFYCYIPKERWYSANSDSDTAPFDVDFYIIMNLAVGGKFDSLRRPDDSFTSAEMLVDYVRVYKEEGTIQQPATIPVEGLKLTSTATELTVGQTAEITKVFTPSNTTQKNVEWTSSNESVAKVSGGQVTAVGAGTAVITATSTANSNISSNITITVKEEQVAEPENPGTETEPEKPGTDTEPEKPGTDTEPENPGTDTEPEKDNFVPTTENGIHRNSDGTITFYVKAQDTAFGPMAYYGVNLDSPALYKMAGVALAKNTAFGENYFSFTTAAKYSDTDVVSVLFSYTPLDGTGRIDTEITTIKLSDIVETQPEETEPEKTEPEKQPETENPDTGSETETNTESGDIFIYQDINYGGRVASLGLGEYNLASLQAKGFKNDDLSSLKVPFGYKVTLYSDDNFKGETRVITSDTSWIGSDYNDVTSSIKVEKARYNIVSRHSGLCLDVTSANLASGTNIQQWEINGTNAQIFEVSKNSDGTYVITSALHGKALDMGGWSKDNGGNLIIWDNNNTDNQRWYINEVGDGYCSIINKYSNKAIDVADWSTSIGGNIHQWDYFGQSNQQWKFVLVN